MLNRKTCVVSKTQKRNRSFRHRRPYRQSRRKVLSPIEVHRLRRSAVKLTLVSHLSLPFIVYEIILRALARRLPFSDLSESKWWCINEFPAFTQDRRYLDPLVLYLSKRNVFLYVAIFRGKYVLKLVCYASRPNSCRELDASRAWLSRTKATVYSMTLNSIYTQFHCAFNNGN